MLYTAVAAILEGWRGDLSYRELARRANMAQPSVSAILQGESVPKAETVAALCEALGRTEADLMRAVGEAAGAAQAS